MQKLTKAKKVLLIVLIVEIVLVLASIFTLSVYSSGSYEAINIKDYTKSNDYVDIEYKNNNLYFKPTDENINKTEKGLIFYPGGLVEKEAYSPIMYELSLMGYYTVIIDMPFNLALFGKAKAKSILNEESNIDWYIGGHSLGGAMASSFYSSNMDKISGLILMAAYSTKDITSGNVLSIKGSNDKVLNIDKYNKYNSMLPSKTEYVEIEGGNHSYFASYGMQKGDGEATITKEEQWNITVNSIISFMNK